MATDIVYAGLWVRQVSSAEGCRIHTVWHILSNVGIALTSVKDGFFLILKQQQLRSNANLSSMTPNVEGFHVHTLCLNSHHGMN